MYLSVKDCGRFESFANRELLSSGRLDTSFCVGSEGAVLEFSLQGQPFVLKTRFLNRALDIVILGETAEAKRYLRNSLVGRFAMESLPSEVHILSTFSQDYRLSQVTKMFKQHFDQLVVEGDSLASSLNSLEDLAPAQVAVQWWDKQANFGDAVGPWLIHRMTGLLPVNSRERKLRAVPVISVGSILAEIRVPGTQIWGTGLMRPLEPGQVKTLKAVEGVEVLAVRGKRTQVELVEKLGWDVPNVFGDPALLLPRFHPKATLGPSKNKIALVPHYVHTKFVEGNPLTGVHLVDVKNSLEIVADEISAADLCISSSLHGVILAQAYGVPWIWLRVLDKPLGGDTFKFEDFFSTIDEKSAAIVETKSEELQNLDFSSLRSKASLPVLKISLDALENAMPVSRRVEASPSASSVPRLTFQAARKAMAKVSGHAKSLVNSTAGKKDPLEVFVVNPAKQNPDISITPAPVIIEQNIVSPDKEIHRLLRELLSEVRTQRKLIETMRVVSTSPVITSVREFIYGKQLTLEETLDLLCESNRSFARFGDGEFRLLVHPEEHLRFQRNSPELRARLQEVLDASRNDEFLIGFPLVYSDNSWTKIWQDLWPMLKKVIPQDAKFANSHVTRPVVFSQLGDVAVRKWRSVWDGKNVVIITGKGSRFELADALFDNVSSVARIDSLASEAFEDIPRLLSLAKESTADIFLIALGPAGTVLAFDLAKLGHRALDIGHLSDSYANVFEGAMRPESKPIAAK